MTQQCSGRAPRFDSQHPSSGSKPSATPVPEDSFPLLASASPRIHRHVCGGANHPLKEILLKNVFLSHTIHPDCSFPSFYSSQFSLPLPLSPRSTPPLLPFRKEQASLPGISTKHSITSSIRLDTTSRRKRVPRAGEVRDMPHHCWGVLAL